MVIMAVVFRSPAHDIAYLVGGRGAVANPAGTEEKYKKGLARQQ